MGEFWNDGCEQVRKINEKKADELSSKSPTNPPMADSWNDGSEPAKGGHSLDLDKEYAKNLFKSLAIEPPGDDDEYEWYICEGVGLGGLLAKMFLARPCLMNPMLPKLRYEGAYGSGHTRSAYDKDTLQQVCSLARIPNSEIFKKGITLDALDLGHINEPHRPWNFLRFYKDPLETKQEIANVCGLPELCGEPEP